MQQMIKKRQKVTYCISDGAQWATLMAVKVPNPLAKSVRVLFYFFFDRHRPPTTMESETHSPFRLGKPNPILDLRSSEMPLSPLSKHVLFVELYIAGIV
ncbi:unnamed protein product [Caenorhabditis nigoni]